MVTSETAINMQQPTHPEETTSNPQDASELGQASTNIDQVRFIKAYTTWANSARHIRTALKTFCSAEDLHDIKQRIQNQHNAISECYESIQCNSTSTPDIVKKMDACIMITSEICELVDKFIDTVGQPFNDELAKLHIRMMLDKHE